MNMTSPFFAHDTSTAGFTSVNSPPLSVERKPQTPPIEFRNGQGQRFLHIVNESTRITRSDQFARWLRGELQEFLPHEVLLTAHGDFSRGEIHCHILPASMGERAAYPQTETPGFVPQMFERWLERGRCAFSLNGAPLMGSAKSARGVFDRHLGAMRAALVHGVHDSRQRIDTLYILLHSVDSFGQASPRLFEFLLPHIDCASRRLPELFRNNEDDSRRRSQRALEQAGLTLREIEILEWVGNGKTNYEIGRILEISPFTVKNHLQRIYRKLDVTRRAQAIAKTERISRPTPPC